MNELPVFEKSDLINCHRLRKMGELVVEILHRRAVAYALEFDDYVDVSLILLAVQLLSLIHLPVHLLSPFCM